MSSTDLFSPFHLGPLTLPNRVVMAPMTRNRAGPGNVPVPLNATYYAQRASAGLIVSEATQVSPQGVGYPGTPGIHSAEQVAGWKLVTDAVHGAGGRIFLQLWHVGRISHPSLQPGGALPVAPSAIAPAGQAMTRERHEAFRHAARARDRRNPRHRRGLPARRAPNARDGRLRRRRIARRQRLSGRSVLARQHQSSHRPLRRQRAEPRALSDRGDGSAGRRMGRRARRRAAVADQSPFNDMADSDPAATFTTAVGELNRFGLAYLHVVEPADGDPVPAGEMPDMRFFRKLWRGPLIGQQGLRSGARQGGAARRRRRSGVVRGAVPRQSRSARAPAPRRTVQSAGTQDLLWRRRRRLHRLSGFGGLMARHLRRSVASSRKVRSCDAGHFRPRRRGLEWLQWLTVS